jgi:poly(3-hydroxybutyrate) depolymerase
MKVARMIEPRHNLNGGVTTRSHLVIAAGRLLLTALLAIPLRCLAEEPLPALNVDTGETSISGISSGAFMAVQFEVAHSSIVKGVGVIAGGPYYCSQDSGIAATTRCSCTFDPAHLVCSVSPTSAHVAELVSATRRFARDGKIDDPGNLDAHRVIVIAGAQDPIVPIAIAAQVVDYYRQFSVPAANISTIALADAGHTMPTLAYGNRCSVTDSPYIGKCKYAGAREVLSWIYGSLKPSRKGRLKGRLVKFDQSTYVPQTSFLWDTGMDATGWIFVPKECDAGERCRLHIALHGCQQGQSYLPLRTPPDGGLYYGTTFVRHAGYLPPADTNRVVVLFPQAVSIPGINPNGCWDWWGYTGDDFATKHGVQITAIRAMADRIASGRR